MIKIEDLEQKAPIYKGLWLYKDIVFTEGFDDKFTVTCGRNQLNRDGSWKDALKTSQLNGSFPSLQSALDAYNKSLNQ